jgi:hypothetical protein
VVPAALVAGFGEDLSQSRPEPQGPVAHRQQRRLGHASLPQRPQHPGPGLPAFPVALLDRQQLLASVGAHPDHHQQDRLLMLQTGLEVDPIREQVGVAPAEGPSPPELALLGPLLLEPQDAIRRQRRGGANQGPEHRLEVAAGQSLQVQPAE